ncbi:MAG: hypothetical protein ACRDHN_21920 [Thermomicrobiales bacterium]
MNRRAVISTAAAILAAPTITAHAQTSPATPALPPLPPSILEPVELAPGLTMTYCQYTLYPEYGTWGVFAECQNTTSTAKNTVNSSARLTDDAGNVYWDESHTVTTHVVQPGESFIAGGFIYPDTVTGYTKAELILNLDGWGSSEWVTQRKDISLEVVNDQSIVTRESPTSGRVTGYVDIKNNGSVASNITYLHYAVRDQNHRVVHCTTTFADSPIEPGIFVRVRLNEPFFGPWETVELLLDPMP